MAGLLLSIPVIGWGFETMKAEDYPSFLAARRQLIALKIKDWFEAL